MSISTNGLVFYFDSINNVGDNTHNPNTNVWKDLSGNNNDATITGASFEDNRLSFNGVDNWVNCGQHNYSNVTLDVLVEFNTIGSGSANCVFSNAEAGGWGIQQYNDKNCFCVSINGTWYFSYGSDCSTGQKIHFTASYDGSVIKFYENGVLVDTITQSGSIKNPSNSTVVSIGSNPNGSSIGITPLDGYVYSARLYNRALTEEEVLTNYTHDYNRYTNPEKAEYYKISSSTLTSFADQARRISGEEGTLTTAQMLEIFEGVVYDSQKYNFNGIVLPKLPSDIPSGYDYHVIYGSATSGYQLLCGKANWYIKDSGDYGLWCSYGDGTKCVEWYQCKVTDGVLEDTWSFRFSNSGGSFSSKTIKWSSHDIHQVSGSTPVIFFEHSEPIPVKEFI